MADWKTVTENDNYKVNEFGEIFSSLSGRKLKPTRFTNGYEVVTLCGPNGHHKRLVHQIVATEFVENPNGYSEVNHKDGDKTNNRADNLEWCTRSQSMKHACETGLQKPNKEQIKSSLSRAVDKLKVPVRNIETGECYRSVSECARKEGVTSGAITQHLTGKVKKKRFEYLYKGVE